MQRAVVRIAALVLASEVLSVAHSSLAYADANASDSGGTISVGASSATSSGGAPGPAAGLGAITAGDASPGAGTAASGPVCGSAVLTFINTLGPPAGVSGPGSWYTTTCTGASGSTTSNGWVPSVASGAAPAPGAGPAPAVSPYAVAMQAENSLLLPSPTLQFNPPTFSVVHVSTWAWLPPAMWHPYSVSASVGPVTATATATPVSVTWNFGDGSTLICSGPGTPYRTDLPPSAQQTSCAHTYVVSSMGQPSPDGNPNDDAFRVTATVAWLVSWTAQGAPGGGSLPSLTTTSADNLRVEQVESVN